MYQGKGEQSPLSLSHPTQLLPHTTEAGGVTGGGVWRETERGLFTPLPHQFIVDLSDGKMDTFPFVSSIRDI